MTTFRSSGERGPTTEELRARALAVTNASDTSPPGSFLDLVRTAGYDAGADALTVTGIDGRVLLRIGPAPEYRWEVGPEDAPEAARIFAETVRDHFMRWGLDNEKGERLGSPGS